MNKIILIYRKLLEEHGHQGWWPVKGGNDLKAEYHRKDYSFPRNDGQAFEIMAGAILTQSTSWKNVEKALDNLRQNKALNPESIKKLKTEKLAELIKSSGYHNQKARKLKSFVEFYISGREFTRENLLNVWGIGPETADSILLYALKKPHFVVDAYTKRIFSRLRFFEDNEKYENIQKLFYDNLKKDFKLFNEFHALIVEHAKACCGKNESGKNCCLAKLRIM
ncbi:endonuclease III domain-containing protein [Candidatus Woesearchaeota archaeon]|nr:endonuclease III domain-containing protein [Candidatus Woesearchaeota archaeon]